MQVHGDLRFKSLGGGKAGVGFEHAVGECGGATEIAGVPGFPQFLEKGGGETGFQL